MGTDHCRTLESAIAASRLAARVRFGAVTRRTGGQVAVDELIAGGAEQLFGLPGVQLDWFFDALAQRRDRLRVLHTRHEQGAAYMADGYARTTGRPGVCAVVPGPGLLNTTAALATAYACSSPVLCVTGQVDSHAIDGGYGLLHEVQHQDQVLSAVTKWSGRPMKVAEIAPAVREAFTQLASGRPRPVGIELPLDILPALEDVVAPDTARQAENDGSAARGLETDPDRLRDAADLLRLSQRPVIYSGGGILAASAWTALQALAERLEAPVVMSVDGRGALSDRHHLAHTGVTGESLVAEADVLLGVGTRFWQPARVWGLRPATRVIRIDIDPVEIDRLGPSHVAIVGDARSALEALNDLLQDVAPRRSRCDELHRRKLAVAEQLAAYQPQAAYAAALRAAVPDDTIFVNDLTQVTFFATVGLPVYEPRTFIGPGYQGTLGSAFATALGAQAGHPDRPVVALSGDGGFLYTIGELATQRQHNLPVVSVVFNDQAFGNVLRTQQEAFDGRLIASELVNPDFVALACSFGIDSERVASPEALGGALGSAVKARRPALIEVSVGPMPNVWPVIIRAGGVYPIMLPR
jgi:acetolactate synthase-1/2/3 large subunit